jgi:DTW domain-containing protein YfiP
MLGAPTVRSHTTSDLPGRCRRCWVRVAHCICNQLPQVETHARITVVRHEREVYKSTGTARIAGLALPRLSFVDYGDDATEVERKLQGVEGFLLFPADPPAPWPKEPVDHLILLDGTWRQARKMLKKLPSLQRLPKLTLPAKNDAVLRLRDPTVEGGRSTLEALADALGLLEGESVATPLNALHDLYVERVLKARGTYELVRRNFEA